MFYEYLTMNLFLKILRKFVIVVFFKETQLTFNYLYSIIIMATVNTTAYQLPLSFNQIIELVKQLPINQKKKLIKTLLPETIDNTQDFEVPEWQQKIVLDRIKNSKPEDYITIEESNKRLKKKYGF